VTRGKSLSVAWGVAWGATGTCLNSKCVIAFVTGNRLGYARVSSLQHELKKKQPFDSPEQEATLSIMRTADQLHIRFTRLFRRYGVTGQQYNILRILRGDGAPLPILEIASRMITVVPGITGLIDRLETAGLVQRKRCDEDRRVVYVSITDKALSLLDEIEEPLNQEHQRLLGHLNPEELSKLNQLLAKVRAPMAGADEEV
jgi:MarR family transcriptional regulator, 2-MHQ and catechol-resistance regulon repressor